MCLDDLLLLLLLLLLFFISRVLLVIVALTCSDLVVSTPDPPDWLIVIMNCVPGEVCACMSVRVGCCLQLSYHHLSSSVLLLLLYCSLLFAVMQVFCVFRIVFVVNCSYPLHPLIALGPSHSLTHTHTAYSTIDTKHNVIWVALSVDFSCDFFYCDSSFSHVYLVWFVVGMV